MESSFDWNWFFSTLSQSSAALIGLIGAFVITRILNMLEKSVDLGTDLEILNEQAFVLRNKMKYFDFRGINEHFMNCNFAFIQNIFNKKYDSLSDKEVIAKIYELDKNLFFDDIGILSNFKKVRTSCRNVIFESQLALNSNPYYSAEKLIESKAEFKKINIEIIEIKRLILKYARLKRAPRRFASGLKMINWIIWLLIFIFPVTVILPLLFMPVILNKVPVFPEIAMSAAFILKCGLLSIFFIGIELVFIYLLNMTNKVNDNLQFITNGVKDDFLVLRKYCPYSRDEFKFNSIAKTPVVDAVIKPWYKKMFSVIRN